MTRGRNKSDASARQTSSNEHVAHEVVNVGGWQAYRRVQDSRNQHNDAAEPARQEGGHRTSYFDPVRAAMEQGQAQQATSDASHAYNPSRRDTGNTYNPSQRDTGNPGADQPSFDPYDRAAAHQAWLTMTRTVMSETRQRFPQQPARRTLWPLVPLSERSRETDQQHSDREDR
jgi:hypothetical protein